MSTTMAKKETVKRQWFVIDATNLVVGRLAVQISNILRGKHRPDYTPYCDAGDFVIVINAEKVQFTGNKWNTQEYAAYTGYPGGLRITTAKDMLAKHPERIIEFAVKRMMPKNKLARKQLSKLKIYAGPKHDHQAQQPVEFKMPK